MKNRSVIKVALLSAILIFSAVHLSAQKKDALKIISYNILKGMETDKTEGKQVFVEWIKAQDPDILAIQEANYFTQKSLEALARTYGHPYAVLLRAEGYPPAITSKYPIVNVERVVDNMWHGFVKCTIEGYEIIVLHFSPHVYMKRREEVAVIVETVKQSGSFKKWMVMGDFNAVSPLDKSKYADGKYKERLRSYEEKNPKQSHLHEGDVDYLVHQSMLDFGFVDAARQDPAFTYDNFGARIDFIYVSPDLKKRVVKCGFIVDEFTDKYSDHRPVEMVLKLN